jgi:hypothetical protein
MTTTYRVLTNGFGSFKDGLILGTVHQHRDGWRFHPMFQADPSRKGWSTPEDALKGRVKHYRLEPANQKN